MVYDRLEIESLGEMASVLLRVANGVAELEHCGEDFSFFEVKKSLCARWQELLVLHGKMLDQHDPGDM